MSELPIQDWSGAVGSIYCTRDGHKALIIAYGVRLQEIAYPPGAVTEEVHAAIMDRLDGGQSVPLAYHDWKRIICDRLGSWKGGDVIPDAASVAGDKGSPLDLVKLVRVAR
jgi:hypothetical protein